jgi:hypothetical protein
VGFTPAAESQTEAFKNEMVNSLQHRAKDGLKLQETNRSSNTESDNNWGMKKHQKHIKACNQISGNFGRNEFVCGCSMRISEHFVSKLLTNFQEK